MKFLVDSERRQSVRLERPGPRGKGTLTATYRTKNRWVEIPDITCSVYAQAVSDLIDRKVLIVPRRDGVPLSAVPAPADLKFKQAPAPAAEAPPGFEPAPVDVEILEADVETVDVVSGDAPQESQTSGRKYKRRY